MKTLVFASHADDEIIGCGGYLCKLIEAGEKVSIVYLITPTLDRKKEIEAVQKYMGFDKIYLLNYGLGRVTKKTESLMDKVVHIIREYKPHQVLTIHKNEQDRDHRFLYDIVEECSFLADSDFLLREKDEPAKINILLGYEVWTPIQNPQLFIDITKFIRKKTNAMKIYHSQLSKKDYIAMFKGLNQFRGVTSGISSFVEGYYVYRLTELSKIVGKNG